MAQVGLAAQLAKQAAQAAREEVAAQGGRKGAEGVPKGWQPAVLRQDFDLDEAVHGAAVRVAAYFRKVLAPEGLEVGVTREPQEGAQKNGNVQIALQEGETGRVVRAYTAGDLLTLYANQQRLGGVVVDGQV